MPKMNPTAKKLLEDLRAELEAVNRIGIEPPAILLRSISYIQATQDPENQPSQYGTTLVKPD